jgi:hypothetical protein
MIPYTDGHVSGYIRCGSVAEARCLAAWIDRIQEISQQCREARNYARFDSIRGYALKPQDRGESWPFAKSYVSW